jgi:2,4-dienoyl-CoA reductase-like NADH-dependent reductase (Old Yellow Enzyme family)
MSHLFSSYTLRGLTLRNRIGMSPMCMYSAGEDGRATDWHLAHYLARAVGGVGLVSTEATAIEPRGRISRNDLGLWDDSQIEPLARIVALIHDEGSAVAIQLAHAGRKAWSGTKGQGPQPAIAPSAVPYAEGWPPGREMTPDDIEQVIAAWQAAAGRALAAGVDVAEIHAAHGYLAHQFLSPLSNHRTDEYGGSLENRMRFLRRLADAIRQVWPEDRPLFVRVSATDWAKDGLTLDDMVIVARELRSHGLDLADCSTGGLLPHAPETIGPGYQIPFAERIRREARIATAAVGLINTPELAEEVIHNERADMVMLGRVLLRHPYWPLEAARVLGHDIAWPKQYQRARLT